MSSQAWGGRFRHEPSALASRFTESVSFDRRLALVDLEGSSAHARMLAATGTLSAEEEREIQLGLAALRAEVEEGTFHFDPAHEDVHMNLEHALIARIGKVGAKLHTARSRNDQVATDLRLWTRAACRATAARIDGVIAALLGQAAAHVDTVLPGYTHLQRAQPVRLAHVLLAWVEMLERDVGRLHDAATRMNECPLGAGALAGTTFPIDRAMTARTLGFTRPMRNSIDAVADRDFAVEAVGALANLAIHLSRLGEELVLWSSSEFAFVRMSDAFTTGSSMMPQKKNPDVAELVRGKSARVVGDLVALLVLLKGLPLAYNRDLQEDKPPLFDAFDTCDACLDVLAPAIATADFDPDAMARALDAGFMEATELADYLAARGVPFRDAHHVAGQLVRHAVDRGIGLRELTLEELRNAHPAFDEDVAAWLVPSAMLDRRTAEGGPARSRVLEALGDAEARREARRASART